MLIIAEKDHKFGDLKSLNKKPLPDLSHAELVFLADCSLQGCEVRGVRDGAVVAYVDNPSTVTHGGYATESMPVYGKGETSIDSLAANEAKAKKYIDEIIKRICVIKDNPAIILEINKNKDVFTKIQEQLGKKLLKIHHSLLGYKSHLADELGEKHTQPTIDKLTAKSQAIDLLTDIFKDPHLDNLAKVQTFVAKIRENHDPKPSLLETIKEQRNKDRRSLFGAVPSEGTQLINKIEKVLGAPMQPVVVQAPENKL